VGDIYLCVPQPKCWGTYPTPYNRRPCEELQRSWKLTVYRGCVDRWGRRGCVQWWLSGMNAVELWTLQQRPQIPSCCRPGRLGVATPDPPTTQSQKYFHHNPQHHRTITSDTAPMTDNCINTKDTWATVILWQGYYTKIHTDSVTYVNANSSFFSLLYRLYHLCIVHVISSAVCQMS